MTNSIHSICVFCGSADGNAELHTSAAIEMAHCLAKNNIQLVYGGACIGIMGTLAKTCLELGVEVIGVQPDFLQKHEVSCSGIKLISADNMQSRKQKMLELSDAFIIMPGGLGTLDELFEVWVLAQLDQLAKPIGILNTNQIFTPLLQGVKHIQQAGFLKQDIFDYMKVETEPALLLQQLQQTQQSSFLLKKFEDNKKHL